MLCLENSLESSSDLFFVHVFYFCWESFGEMGDLAGCLGYVYFWSLQVLGWAAAVKGVICNVSRTVGKG